MKDKILIALDGKIKISLVTIKKTLTKATYTHDMWPTGVRAFGRVLSLTSIMGYKMRDDEEITTIINGDGPLGVIKIIANNLGHIRGYIANPFVSKKPDKETSDVALGIGTKGKIKIIKNSNSKKPYVTEIEMITGEMLDEFNSYFSKLNQAPSGILISTLLDGNHLKNAGAILFEFLPGYTENDTNKVRKAINNISPLSISLDKNSMYKILVSNFPKSEIIEEGSVKWKCSCDLTKILEMIKSLKIEKKSIDEMKNKESINCEYCGKKYRIKKNDIKGN